MFMLTQLTLAGATSSAGCVASNFHAWIFSKRTKRFEDLFCRERRAGELSSVVDLF